MQSTRLPGKILLPVPLGNGKPLLKWITDELKLSHFKKDIIIATSQNKENDVLELFCTQNNIQCFRGEEENVLSRFLAIIKQKEYDVIVRLTADNPFVDLPILEHTIAFHHQNKFDYTSTQGLPLGMNFEIISPYTLLDSEHYILSDADKEHVTLFIKNNDQYKKGIFKPQIKKELKDLRLTIDYPSDFTLVSTILSQCNSDAARGIQLIEQTYRKYEWLFESNSKNFQKKQYPDINDEIKEAGLMLRYFDMKRAASLLDNK